MLHSAQRLAPLVALVVGIFLCSCAADRHRLVLDTIGPESGGRLGLSLEGTGYLQVLTATERHNDGGIPYFPHTPYSIYALEGKRVKGVSNHAGHTDQRAAIVELPAGTYLVFAQSERFGQVKVPVQIVDRQLTVVHLEGTGMPLTENISESALVRLPDGRVAGRRAVSPAEPKP